MEQKVIKLNPAFLNTGQSKSETRSKKTKSMQKIKSKTNSLGEHKLRKKLMSRIHEFQARTEENAEIDQGFASNSAVKDVKDEIQVFDTEFDNSIGFLKELAERKKQRKKKRDTIKNNHGYVNKNANDKIRINTANLTAAPAPAAPVGHISPVAHIAPVAHVAPVAPIAHVAPVAPIAHVAPVAPIAHVAPVAPIAHVAPEFPRHKQTIKIKPPPPYTCLKNSHSAKPTYRQWMTRGHNQPNDGSNKENIKIHQAVRADEPSIRSNKLAEIKSQFSATNNKQRLPRKMPRKILRKKMITVKHKLGKSGRKVCVLIKNHNTRKQIQHECSALKQTKISEIRKYLKKHNLLKGGSVAPNDVLKATYEQAILAGDVVNKSYDTLIHNYNTKEDK